MFTKLLVLYDFSEPSKFALEWALRLGATFHSHIKVVHVVPVVTTSIDVFFTSQDIMSQVKTRIQLDIDQMKHRHKEIRAGSVEILAYEGKPAPLLLNCIAREDPDLVIMSTHGHTGLSHLFMGSTAEKIVRHSPNPVLVCRKDLAWPPKVVVLPIELAEDPEETLLLATQLAQHFPVEFKLVHALLFAEAIGYFPETPAIPATINYENLEKQAKERLETIVKQHPSLHMTSLVCLGRPADEINNLAGEFKADLIMIPTHGRTGLSHLFMGSVAEEVIRYAPCSVLSIPPIRSADEKRKWIAALR